jgi:hypothetical protein
MSDDDDYQLALALAESLNHEASRGEMSAAERAFFSDVDLADINQQTQQTEQKAVSNFGVRTGGFAGAFSRDRRTNAAGYNTQAKGQTQTSGGFAGNSAITTTAPARPQQQQIAQPKNASQPPSQSTLPQYSSQPPHTSQSSASQRRPQPYQFSSLPKNSSQPQTSQSSASQRRPQPYQFSSLPRAASALLSGGRDLLQQAMAPASQIICHSCNQPCVPGEQYIKAGDSLIFHTDCFRCAACNELISQSSSISLREGSVYHTACSIELFAPKCIVCLDPLDGQHARHPFFEDEK